MFLVYINELAEILQDNTPYTSAWDRESSQPAGTADSNHRQLNICYTSAQSHGLLAPTGR